MKKILSIVVLAAAVAMVGCAGNGEKKACEQCACEQCEAAAEVAPEAAPAEAAAEAAPAEAAAEVAPEAAPAEAAK